MTRWDPHSEGRWDKGKTVANEKKPALPQRQPGQNGTLVGGERQPVPQAEPKKTEEKDGDQ